jgi:hypothetical protein
MKDSVIPCSDLAGEIVTLGDAVKDWKEGDRVCADFSLDHIDGDITPEIQATGLERPLTVCSESILSCPLMFVFLITTCATRDSNMTFASHLSNSPSIYPLRRHPHYPAQV